MKRFALLAIAVVGLVLGFTSCKKPPVTGTIQWELKDGKGNKVLDKNQATPYPFIVVITPAEGTTLNSVMFSFVNTTGNTRTEIFKDVKIERDKDSTKISDLGGAGSILISGPKGPGKYVAPMNTDKTKPALRAETGEFTFTVKDSKGTVTTFMVKLGPAPSPKWTKDTRSAMISNILAADNGSLNLKSGKTVNISASKDERYLMNNSTSATFNPGFTSDKVMVGSSEVMGNGTLFYKVPAGELDYDKTMPMDCMKYVSKIKETTIDGLQVGDLILAYHNAGQPEAFMIRVKKIDANAGGTNKGTMTLEWKSFFYM